MTNINNKFNDLSNLSNDEIDLKSIFDFFFRNKFKISFVSFIFFILAIAYSYSLKKIWEGKFQIVLNDDKPMIMEGNLNPNLASALGISQNNNLDTEVGILKSPSLLLPIFEFVESSENKLSKNKKIYFADWKKKNLDIKLEKGTSILNISYRDKNKKIIIPVLKKISNTYQQYSGKKKKRALELSKEYLRKQIIISKDKSSSSLKDAQDFAIEQDLILYTTIKTKDLNENSSEEDYDFVISPNIGIENIRVQSANRIRRIDMQIKKITEMGNDIEKLQYIFSTIPALVKDALPTELTKIEKELLEKRIKYNDVDQSILRLIKKRELLINLLKKRTIGYLQAERVNTEATMQAAMRPKGILLKYKELIRQAGRDESTLINLENQLEFIQLEQAKLEDPWELITNPTLLKDHVGPSRLRISLFGLLSGFFISSGFLFYKEKKSESIFNIYELEQFFNFKFIEEIKNKDLLINSKKVLYLKELINKLPEKVFLFVVGDIVDKNLKSLEEAINVKNKSKKYILTLSSYEKLNSISAEDNIILITSLGLASNSDMLILKKFIDLNRLNLCGLILLDN